MSVAKRLLEEQQAAEEAKMTARCERCDEPYDPSYWGAPLCDYCRHMADKDD